MTKITAVINGESGLSTRTKINTSLKGVSTNADLKITGDGNVGTELTLDDTKIDAGLVPYDNTTSGLTATEVEPAIDELSADKISLNSGFDNNTDSEFLTVNGTRTFTIQPTGIDYSFNVGGKTITKTAAESIVISDVEGEHFIYFDNAGALAETTTFDPAIIYTFAYVASLYWNVANQEFVVVGDERHGNIMDGETHSYLHTTRGTQYVSGLGISATTGATTVATDSGVIRDEDITENLSAQTTFYTMYKDGVSGDWKKTAAASTSPYQITGSNIDYNEFTGTTWQTTETPNNDYVNVILFATNDVRAGHQVVAIMPQAVYTSLNLAREGRTTELANLSTDGLAFQEFVPMGVGTYHTSDLNLKDTYEDLRATNNFASGSFTTHNTLSGRSDLNSHPTTAVSYDNTISGLTATNAKTAIDEVSGKQHLNNEIAIIAPTVNDDSTADYEAGSRWIDTVLNKEYVCLDNTTGAAIWTETTSSGGGAATYTGVAGNLVSDISLSNLTWVYLNWAGTDFDTDAFWSAGSPSMFTVPAGLGGKYLITGYIYGRSTVTPTSEMNFRGLPRLNGTNLNIQEVYSDNRTVLTTGQVGSVINISMVVDMVPTDIFEFRVNIGTIPVRSVIIDKSSTIQMTKIG